MATPKTLVALLLLLCCLLKSNSASSQTPDWAWARSGHLPPGNGFAYGLDVATDAAGNIYALGEASNSGVGFSINFPALPRGMFLVKYTPQGNPIWARSGGKNSIPIDLFTDAGGNSYITGQFRDTLVLGGNTFIAKGQLDMFTVKYDSAGNVLWARQAGGPDYPIQWGPGFSFDGGRAIAADSAGNCYVAGLVVSSDTALAYFDSVAVPPLQPSLYPEYVNVLAKYNASGNIEWVKKVAITGWIYRIAISNQGDIGLAGSFSGSVSVGGTLLTSVGATDVFYASYNTAGDFNWAKSFGGPNNDYNDGIAFDNVGNMYVSGSFSDTLQFSSDTLITTPSSVSVFLAKCDSNGNVIWARQTYGSGDAYWANPVVDSSGNSYIACWFDDTVQVGGNEFVSVNALSDVLIAKWNNAGDLEWATAAQGLGMDWVKGIALNPDQTECYITGTYFYDLAFGTQTLTTSGSGNFYLAKLQNIITATPDWITETDWAVYPNPAQKELYLQLPQSQQIKQVQLISPTGQTVLSQKPAACQEIKLQLPALPKGLYVLAVQTENQVLRRKIVIQ